MHASARRCLQVCAGLPSAGGSSARDVRLLSARGPLRQPRQIGTVHYVYALPVARAIKDGAEGVRITPLVDFGMAVGKTQAARAAVVAGWELRELPGSVEAGGVGVQDPVVNGVGMFVGEHPRIRGRRCLEVAGFYGPVSEPSEAAADGAIVLRTGPYSRVHGDTPDAIGPTKGLLLGTEVIVRWAPENLSGLCHIRSQQRGPVV